jgi:hypothetical protein
VSTLDLVDDGPNDSSLADIERSPLVDGYLDLVAKSHGLTQVFADWEVVKTGAFGAGTPTTLTAYLVNGTAPGIVTGSERPISNVISETFTIGA